jgi:hypothetical protein
MEGRGSLALVQSDIGEEEATEEEADEEEVEEEEK